MLFNYNNMGGSFIMAKYHSMLESYLSYDSNFYFILYRHYNGIELDGDVGVVVV